MVLHGKDCAALSNRLVQKGSRQDPPELGVQH